MDSPRVGGSLSLDRYTTVFQAEIYVIWACVDEIKTKLNQRNTLVFPLIVKQVRKLFKPLKQRPHWYPPFCWHLCVPVHSGIRENEIADGLAREGSADQFVGP